MNHSGQAKQGHYGTVAILVTQREHAPLAWGTEL